MTKVFSGTLTQCQTAWIQIRTDILPVLIWIQTVDQHFFDPDPVQTVYKGYQQMTKVLRKELNIVLLIGSV